MNPYTAFCEKYGLSAEFRQVAKNPNIYDKKWDAAHWKVTIKLVNREFVTHYSKGRGHYEGEIKAYYKRYRIYPDGLPISALIDLDNPEVQSDYRIRVPLKLPAPALADVLISLMSDYETIANGETVYQWEQELGYGWNSQQSQRVFDAIADNTNSLIRLLGRSAFNELFEIGENDGYEEAE